MNRNRILIALLALCIICGVLSARADGKVTTANTNPITTWRIADLRFPGLDDNRATAIVTVKYYRADGSIDHVEEKSLVAAKYTQMLAAINLPSGADEATLRVTTTNPDGTTTTRADLGAIFRLRISRWMVASGEITGVTAEAVAPGVIFTEPNATSPPATQ